MAQGLRAVKDICKLTTETGAGQWGTSLSFACALFGIEVQVFQLRVSYNQKPYRRAVMETYGAACIAFGSVLNHVLLHQTIMGEEAILQLQMAGDDPDVIIGCAANTPTILAIPRT